MQNENKIIYIILAPKRVYERLLHIQVSSSHQYFLLVRAAGSSARLSQTNKAGDVALLTYIKDCNISLVVAKWLQL